ncbi:hypothetical protein IP84_10520 [beta proteobacterium AAP99]|nr:hypothetical protein IP84_10520 [beta proteobacterium AAP99]
MSLLNKSKELAIIWAGYFVFFFIVVAVSVYGLGPLIVWIRTGSFGLIYSIGGLLQFLPSIMLSSLALAVVMLAWEYLKSKQK